MIGASYDGGRGRDAMEPPFIDDDSPEYDVNRRRELADEEADRRHDAQSVERRNDR